MVAYKRIANFTSCVLQKEQTCNMLIKTTQTAQSVYPPHQPRHSIQEHNRCKYRVVYTQ
jgi:hypothetical protein